jgi:hypothetical protein
VVEVRVVAPEWVVAPERVVQSEDQPVRLVLHQLILVMLVVLVILEVE